MPRTHSHTLRVRYAETDQMGYVYYANYLAWFEVGRAEWLRAEGRTYRSFEDEGCMLPVVEAHARYRRAARYDELIELVTWPSLVRAATVRFEYQVLRAADKGLLAEGSTTHACVNKEGKPVRFPVDVHALLTSAVGNHMLEK